MPQVTRKDAVDICLAIGFAAATKWKRPRMEKKLVELAGMAEQLDVADELDDPRLVKVWETIVEAGGEVELVESLDDDAETAPKRKATKKKAAKVDPEPVVEDIPEPELLADGNDDAQDAQEGEQDEPESAPEPETDTKAPAKKKRSRRRATAVSEDAPEKEEEPETPAKRKGKKTGTKNASVPDGKASCREKLILMLCDDSSLTFKEVHSALESEEDFVLATARTTFSTARKILSILRENNRL